MYLSGKIVINRMALNKATETINIIVKYEANGKRGEISS
jgi:hypothetical protein